MPVNVRLFRVEDIDFALAQATREGWESTAAMFGICLAHDPEGCFIAEVDNRRVGMITTTRYARSAWIGNLIVVPERRRQGIGETLMAHAINQLKRCGMRTIRLEGDPLGIGIYRRLGFVDQFDSLRFRKDPPHAACRLDAMHLHKDDLHAAAALDRAGFGDDRGRLLEMLLELACGAYSARVNGRVEGYAMALPSAAGVRLGPAVAASPAVASELLDSVLADFPDLAIVVGVPSVNRATVALLEERGFAPAPSSLRMQWGAAEAEGESEKLVAIANGAMG